MLSRSYLSANLSSLLFLSINKNILSKLFNYRVTEDIYLPMKVNEMVNEVKLENSLEEIPVKFFVEGMYYIIGCDEDFKYSDTYRTLLISNEWCTAIVKGIIASYIKESNYMDSYLLLRGLYIIEPQREYYEKLLWCLHSLYKNDKKHLEELRNIIEHGKSISNPSAYFYEGLLLSEEASFIDARNSLNFYLSLGGESTEEVLNFINEIKTLSNLEEGKNNAKSNPRYALELLLPLLDEMEEDAYIYYYVAVAYRNIGIYQKAIYYLNEAIRLDSSIVDIYNELGLNYACLNDNETAILYFRKAFEVTRSVEICTNLIMCYLNKGDIKQAEAHLEIGKKIDEQDEILKNIEGILRGNNTNDGN